MMEPSTRLTALHKNKQPSEGRLQTQKHSLMKRNRLGKAQNNETISGSADSCWLHRASSENIEKHSSFLPFAVEEEKKELQSEGKMIAHKYLYSLPCLAKINSNDSSRLRVNLSTKTAEICPVIHTKPPSAPSSWAAFSSGLNTNSAALQFCPVGSLCSIR